MPKTTTQKKPATKTAKKIEAKPTPPPAVFSKSPDPDAAEAFLRPSDGPGATIAEGARPLPRVDRQGRLRAAVEASRKFLALSEALLRGPDDWQISGCKLSGAVRRASMDLTRALADYRRS